MTLSVQIFPRSRNTYEITFAFYGTHCGLERSDFADGDRVRDGNKMPSCRTQIVLENLQDLQVDRVTTGQNDLRVVSDVNREWSEGLSFPLELSRHCAY